MRERADARSRKTPESRACVRVKIQHPRAAGCESVWLASHRLILRYEASQCLLRDLLRLPRIAHKSAHKRRCGTVTGVPRVAAARRIGYRPQAHTDSQEQLRHGEARTRRRGLRDG